MTKDPLAGEVRLLGAVLGDTIAEQAGAGPLPPGRSHAPGDGRTPRRRCRAWPGARPRSPRPADLSMREAVAPGPSPCSSSWSTWPRSASASVTLRARERETGHGSSCDDSVVEAVSPGCARSGLDEAAIDARFERLRLTPVLTAHPTEARRRTLLLALRRCARLLERARGPRAAARPSTPRRCGTCARRSRCCGTPRRGPTARPGRRSTRSARPWPSSTRRSSAWCPA